MAETLKITQIGLEYINYAKTTGALLDITEFRLGSGVNYVPTGAEISLQGSTYYTGIPSNFSAINKDTLHTELIIDANAGDFSFGEVGVYVNNPSIPAQKILFGLIVFDVAQTKRAKVSTSFGNIITINIALKFFEAATTVNLNINGIKHYNLLNEVNSVDAVPKALIGQERMFRVNRDLSTLHPFSGRQVFSVTSAAGSSPLSNQEWYPDNHIQVFTEGYLPILNDFGSNTNTTTTVVFGLPTDSPTLESKMNFIHKELLLVSFPLGNNAGLINEVLDITYATEGSDEVVILTLKTPLQVTQNLGTSIKLWYPDHLIEEAIVWTFQPVSPPIITGSASVDTTSGAVTENYTGSGSTTIAPGANGSITYHWGTIGYNTSGTGLTPLITQNTTLYLENTSPTAGSIVTITCYAQDNLGNQSSVTQYTITLNNITAPAVSIVTPPGVEFVNQPHSLSTTGTDGGDASVTYLWSATVNAVANNTIYDNVNSATPVVTHTLAGASVILSVTKTNDYGSISDSASFAAEYDTTSDADSLYLDPTDYTFTPLIQVSSIIDKTLPAGYATAVMAIPASDTKSIVFIRPDTSSTAEDPVKAIVWDHSNNTYSSTVSAPDVFVLWTGGSVNNNDLHFDSPSVSAHTTLAYPGRVYALTRSKNRSTDITNPQEPVQYITYHVSLQVIKLGATNVTALAAGPTEFILADTVDPDGANIYKMDYIALSENTVGTSSSDLMLAVWNNTGITAQSTATLNFSIVQVNAAGTVVTKGTTHTTTADTTLNPGTLGSVHVGGSAGVNATFAALSISTANNSNLHFNLVQYPLTVVSGTTAPTVLNTTTVSFVSTVSAFQVRHVSTNKIFVAARRSDGSIVGRVITISGSTVTPESLIILKPAATTSNSLVSITRYGNIGSSRFLVTYMTSGNVFRSFIVDVSSTPVIIPSEFDTNAAIYNNTAGGSLSAPKSFETSLTSYNSYSWVSAIPFEAHRYVTTPASDNLDFTHTISGLTQQGGQLDWISATMTVQVEGTLNVDFNGDIIPSGTPVPVNFFNQNSSTGVQTYVSTLTDTGRNATFEIDLHSNDTNPVYIRDIQISFVSQV